MKTWPLKPLDEIADIEGGSTPRREVPEYWNGGIPWVTPTDLPMPGEGIANVSTTKDYITESGLSSCSAKYLPAGTVLYSSRATIGKIAIADVPLTTNQGFANLIPHEGIDSRFLAYSLWFFTPHIETLAGSTTFREVSRGNFRRFKIPIPPLDEQHRIVAILNEAEALRQLRARADERMAEFIPALFNQMFGDPATNPKGWKEGVLGDVIHEAKDGPHVSPKYADSGIPFLSTRNVRAGRVIWEDLRYITREEAEKHWRKCKPEKGDVLYTKGGTTGIAKAIDFDQEIAVWVHIALLKTNHSVADPMWLESMLNSSFCYSQSQQLTHGIANHDLGLTRMIEIKIYVPPLSLQREFAARVAVAQALLHRAFAGEL